MLLLLSVSFVRDRLKTLTLSPIWWTLMAEIAIRFLMMKMGLKMIPVPHSENFIVIVEPRQQGM